MTYEIIKKNFQAGLWPEAAVRAAVRKGIITVAQFEEITGKSY